MLLPLFIKAEYMRVLIVGGGSVGLRKARTLLEAGAAVTVLGAELNPGLTELDPAPCLMQEKYRPEALRGFNLVLAVTNDPELNRQIASDAVEAGIWVLNGSDGSAGSVVFPAVRHRAGITVAVGTEGSSPGAAREIVEFWDRQLTENRWPQRIEALGAIRRILKQSGLSLEQRRRVMTEMLALPLDELNQRRKQYEDQNRDSGQ